MQKRLHPLVFIVLIGLIYACSPKTDEVKDVQADANNLSNKHQDSSILISNSRGIRLPHENLPVPARWINPDSVSRPKVVPLGKGQTLPMSSNKKYFGKPKIVPIPKELPVIIPGKDGAPLPIEKKVRGKVVLPKQPQPEPAQPLQLSTNAIGDIQTLGVRQGLNSAFVKPILEDRNGYFWFGTGGGGVSRYDGFSFNEYSEEEGLLHSSIYTMMEDSRGNIWIGTDGGGLTKYDGQNFTQFTKEAGMSSNAFGAMFEDSKGYIWFGTTDAGVSRYTPDYLGEETFIHYTPEVGIPHHHVSAIVEDRQGNIWFSTLGGGAARFDGEKLVYYTTTEGLIHNTILSCILDSQGDLWFGTLGGGICRFDGKQFFHYTTEEGLSSNFVRVIYEDESQSLWIGMQYGGVDKYDRDRNRITHFTPEDGFPPDAINSIMKDSRGNMWFGTHGGGIYRYRESSFSYPNPLFSPSLEDDQGRLLEYTDGSLIVFNYQKSTYTQYSLENEGIGEEADEMVKDSKGNIWIGVPESGLIKYDGERFILYTQQEGLVDHDITSIVEDNKGNIWVGTHNNGLNILNEKGIYQFTEAEGLRNSQIHALEADSLGNIWIGFYHQDGGLSRYDALGNHTFFSRKDGLSTNKINTLKKDSKGNIWIGTWNGGINIFDGSTFTLLDEKRGLSNNIISSIFEDPQGRFWISTEQNLSLLIPTIPDSSFSDQKVPGDYQIITFDERDGLKYMGQGGSFLDKDNRIWWKDHSMLDLKQYELPTRAPSIKLNHIELEQVYIDYRRLADTAYLNSLPFGKYIHQAFDSVAAFNNYPVNLRLPHQMNHLSFHFSGIDWTAPHKVKYQFMMEGLDDNWSPVTSENKADYRSLPRGTFTFKVRAAGQNMIWSEPLSYTFTIRPPWWLTWWAYGLYALIILALFSAVRQYELNRLYIKTEARRLEELDNVKTRLYTNITHEFRTPLTIILGITDQIGQNPQKWFREGLQMIRRNGQNLLNLVNQMLDLSKLESGALPVNMIRGDIISYLKYLIESFHSLAESKNIRLYFDTELQKLDMDYDPGKVLNILSNLLSNAIKFTPEGGEVHIKVEQILITSPSLKISVKDTGIGISEENLPFVFDRFYQTDAASNRHAEGSGIGLALTKELVKLLKGEIQVESSPGEGTTFFISLPITRKMDLDINGQVEQIKESIPPLTPISENALELENGIDNTKEEYPLLLIIEDNDDVTRYLIALLNSEYRLQVAKNGREGVAKAIEIVPDIIISDVMMPVMDGLEVCNTLKLDERTSHIPIILLTAKADVQSRIEGLERGADAYLAKPFNKKELLVRLKGLIELRKRLQSRFGNFTLEASPLPNNPSPEEKELQIEDAFLQKVKTFLLENLSNENYGIEQLSDDLGISRVQLHRKLKALTNKSASHYIRAIRLHKGRDLLENTNLNVSQIAYEVGFKHPTYFARLFLEEFGLSPRDIRSE